MSLCVVMWILFVSWDLNFGFPIGPLFKKTVTDSNAPVQEKALDALIAFLRAADADAARLNMIFVSIFCSCLSHLFVVDFHTLFSFL
jgi:hypothetical protein